jgi:hypothetical protein
MKPHVFLLLWCFLTHHYASDLHSCSGFCYWAPRDYSVHCPHLSSCSSPLPHNDLFFLKCILPAGLSAWSILSFTSSPLLGFSGVYLLTAFCILPHGVRWSFICLPVHTGSLFSWDSYEIYVPSPLTYTKYSQQHWRSPEVHPTTYVAHISLFPCVSGTCTSLCPVKWGSLRTVTLSPLDPQVLHVGSDTWRHDCHCCLLPSMRAKPFLQ